VAVVEHVAHHLFAGEGQRQRPGGGHTEVVHGFAAEELAQRRAQHREAIGRAGITGSGPAPLSCSIQRSPGAHHLAEVDRPAVAELARPVAELVPAVAGGVGVHARQQPVAGEHLGERGGLADRRVEPDQLGYFPAYATRRGAATGVGSTRENTAPRTWRRRGSGLGVGGQVSGEAVVEA
jgi:hypothetical protein